MSNTKIEWADQTWNPVTGCTPISEGCANCYAARMAKRLAGRYGYPKDEPFQPGTQHIDKLDEPRKWKSPQRVFVCSMGDLFHSEVPRAAIAGILDLAFNYYIERGHTFMLLTKRPQRMQDEVILWAHIKNIDMTKFDGLWLGVTAENQRTADERIPILLQIPAAKRFVSVEPMLEFMNLSDYLWEHDNRDGLSERDGLDWVIAGPETGPRARSMQTQWMSVLANDCRAAGVPFFDKRDVLGETIQEFPR